MNELDVGLVILFNRILQQVPAVEKLALVLSSPILGYATLAVLTGVLISRKRPGWLVLVMMAGTAVATDSLCHRVIKPLISRARPCMVRVDLWTPAGCGTGFSMPSNHAANFFAIATLTTLLWPRAAPVVFPLALAVGVSRIFLGVHYPTDVLMGAIVGALIALPVGLLLGKPIRDRQKKWYEK